MLRRAVLASSIALALVLLMHMSAENVENELQSVDAARERATHTKPVRSHPQPQEGKGWLRATTTVGDPPFSYGSLHEAAHQANARVAAMRKAYPHTWNKGAVHKDAYPYPQAGHPSKKKSVKTAKINVKRATSALDAAAAAARKASGPSSKIQAVEKALSRQAKDLSAPVHVPPSKAPKVPPPAKLQDSASRVLPLPSQRKPVSWRQAVTLRKKLKHTMLQHETEKARREWKRSLAQKKLQSSEEAAAKEVKWKPAYKKAQEKKAKKKLAQQRMAAAKVAAAKQQALAKQHARNEAARQAKEKKTEEAERVAKNEASINRMESQRTKMQERIQALGDIMPTGEGNIQAGKRRELEDRLRVQEATKVLKGIRKQQVHEKEETARKKQENAVRMALAGQARDALQRFEKATGQSKDGKRFPGLESESDAAEAAVIERAKQATNREKKETKKAAALQKATLQAQKASVDYARHAADVIHQAAKKHDEAKQNLEKLQAELSRQRSHSAKEEKADAKKAAAEAKRRQLHKERAAKHELHLTDKMHSAAQKDLAAARMAAKAANQQLSNVAAWKKKHKKNKKKQSKKQRHKSHGSERLTKHLKAIDKKNTAKDTQIYSTLASMMIEDDDLVGDDKIPIPAEASLKKDQASISSSTFLQLPGNQQGYQDAQLRELDRIISDAPKARQAAMATMTATQTAATQADEATVSTHRAVQEAAQGLKRVDALEDSFSHAQAMVRSSAKADAGSGWNAQTARDQLLQDAYKHAKAAFDGTAAAYAEVLNHEKQRREEAAQRRVERAEEKKKRAQAAEMELHRLQAQEVVRKRARLALVKAQRVEQVDRASARDAAIHEKLQEWEQRKQRVAAQHAEVDKRIALLQSSIRALKEQAGEGISPEHKALVKYSQQLEDAILRGVSLRSVASLIEHTGAGFSDEVISRKVRGLASSGDQETRMTTSEELHEWERKGRTLDQKEIRQLRADIHAHGA
jgi:hypothetical protein